jgi:hypothetical protein
MNNVTFKRVLVGHTQITLGTHLLLVLYYYITIQWPKWIKISRRMSKFLYSSRG